MGKIARITNDGKLLIKGEVIEIGAVENLHNLENVIDDSRRISGNSNGVANYLGDVYWRTDYVLIEPDKTYVVTVDGHVDETMFWHVLDENYNFLLGSGAGTSYIGEGFLLNTPSTAKYIRYSFKYGLEDRISILPDYNSNTRIAENGNLFTKEIVEYPRELEGGRNLLPTEYESFVVDDGTYGWIKLADEGTPLTVKVYDTGADVDMGVIYFGLTKIGKNFSGGGSFWLMANGTLNVTERQTDEATYFSFYGKSRVTFDKIFEKYKIKVEIGNEATPWTPAPEDLGLDYPSDIQYFHMGIKDNILMINELIEGGV